MAHSPGFGNSGAGALKPVEAVALYGLFEDFEPGRTPRPTAAGGSPCRDAAGMTAPIASPAGYVVTPSQLTNTGRVLSGHRAPVVRSVRCFRSRAGTKPRGAGMAIPGDGEHSAPGRSRGGDGRGNPVLRPNHGLFRAAAPSVNLPVRRRAEPAREYPGTVDEQMRGAAGARCGIRRGRHYRQPTGESPGPRYRFDFKHITMQKFDRIRGIPRRLRVPGTGYARRRGWPLWTFEGVARAAGVSTG